MLRNVPLSIQRFFAVIVLLSACHAGSIASAQAPDAVASVIEALPDSPGSLLLPASLPASGDSNVPGSDPVSKFHRIIQPGKTALPLSAGDKIALSFHDRFSYTSFAGTLFSAGLEQVQNGRPHYGTDKGAFGERLGASELTGTSRAVFSYGIYASMLHEDPRYYVKGPQTAFGKRVIYAASRVVVTRKDSGSDTANLANIAGTISSAALANTYYPTQDRDFNDTAISVISSLGTQALTNELHEFLGDIMRKVRPNR
jgi:hypothetical protein